MFSPPDSPRDLEFLYDLNRFNVATSRNIQKLGLVKDGETRAQR
jgi:superfamily I DNA and/or RNA helicase